MEDDFTPLTILEDSIKHDIGLYVSSILRNDIHLRRLPEDLIQIGQLLSIR